MTTRVHTVLSAGFIAQGYAALVGDLPAISTVMGIVWFLLVFPSTVTDFRDWCRQHLRGRPSERERVAALEAEIDLLRAEARAWQSPHKEIRE